MAARRLLAVMLVFLAISTVLAVLAPPPTEDEPETDTRQTSTKATTAPEPQGRMVNRGVELVDTKTGLRGRPAGLAAHVGDQLVITVSTSRRAVTLEGPSLGLTETAAPDAPARLDLFLSGPGRHVISDAATGRPLFRISIASTKSNETEREQ